MNPEILRLAARRAADGVKYLGTWNGYKVYNPTYSGDIPALGEARYILENDEEIRYTILREESIAITDKFFPRKELDPELLEFLSKFS